MSPKLQPLESTLDTAETKVYEPVENISNDFIATPEPDKLSKDKEGQLDLSTEFTLTVAPDSDNEKNLNHETDHDDAKSFATQNQNDDDELEYPEGGFKAYTVVFGSFMGLIPCYGLLNTLGAIETYISENQLSNVKSSTVSWIFSIFLFISFTSCIVSGTYFDRNGARIPLIVGAVFTVGGLFALAQCKETYQFVLSFGITVGFGNGMVMSPLIGVVAHYFNEKRGLYSSIASTGGSIGGICFPIMLRRLFVQVGYAWTIRIFAFIVAACHILAIVFARERLPHVKSTETSIWKKALQYSNCFDYKSFKDPKFIFCTLGCTFGELSVTVAATFFISYLRAKGMSLQDGYVIVTIVNACGVPGRWLTGYLADRVGRFNVMIVSLMFAGILYFVILLPFAKHSGALYTFGAVWGFTTGSIFSLLPVCCGQISRTEEFGRRYSTMYFIVAFGTLAGVPIGGAIIRQGTSSQYNSFIIYCGVLSIAAGTFYMISRAFCVGNKIFKKF